jgi:nucleoside-diphosphate-sugar epimerase
MSAQNKKCINVLVTGGTGFLGNYIVNHLKDSGYKVTSLGRKGKPDIICDLGTQVPELGKQGFSVIVHAAGKAHIMPRSAEEKTAFFQVNLDGTKNLCQALEQKKMLRSFVFISTVAVYGRETGEFINEDHPLLGNSPYAESKIKAEAYLTDWCNRNGVNLSILRLPLVVGQHPPGNLGKMIKAIRKRRFFYVGSYNPGKSMVLAKDVAGIIPAAATVPGVYNLTDGVHPTFHALAEKIASDLNAPAPFTMPVWPFRILSKIGDVVGDAIPFNTNTFQKMILPLTFDDSKARKILKWNPEPVLNLSFI